MEIRLAAVPDTLPDEWLDLLDAQETARFRRLRLDADRRRFLASHVLLRETLSAVHPAVPRAHWRMRCAPSGKWRLTTPGLPTLDFSVAHAAGAAAVAVQPKGRIGIDLERLDASLVDKPLDAVFSARELAELDKAPKDERWRAVLRLWTAKEAYAKLLGLGCELDFRTLALPTDDRTRVRLREVRIGADKYQLALAWHC